MSATVLTLRYFVTHPEERPQDNTEQAGLVIMFIGALFVDGVVIAMLIRAPATTLVILGVLALLWHVAGMFREHR